MTLTREVLDRLNVDFNWERALKRAEENGYQVNIEHTDDNWKYFSISNERAKVTVEIRGLVQTVELVYPMKRKIVTCLHDDGVNYKQKGLEAAFDFLDSAKYDDLVEKDALLKEIAQKANSFSDREIADMSLEEVRLLHDVISKLGKK